MVRFLQCLVVSCSFLVLAGLGIAMAHDNEGPLKVTTLVKSTDAWDGKPLPSYPKGQPEITILRIIIPAGERTPLHIHPVINAGVLLRGELDVHMENGKHLKMNAGDSLIEVVDKPHWGQNNGRVDAEIVVFYAGVKGESLTEKLDEHDHPIKP